MTPDATALIACESVLDPILQQLTAVLDEHSANFADPVAEALERLRSTAVDTSQHDDLGRHPRGAWAHTTPAPLGSRRTPPTWSYRLTCFGTTATGCPCGWPQEELVYDLARGHRRDPARHSYGGPAYLSPRRKPDRAPPRPGLSPLNPAAVATNSR